MFDFKYRLIRLCHRGGVAFYHVYPESEIGYLPQDYGDLKLLVSHPRFSVVSFPDCTVTLFASGRMLIEDLVEDSEGRAHAIIREIISMWRRSDTTPPHP